MDARGIVIHLVLLLYTDVYVSILLSYVELYKLEER